MKWLPLIKVTRDSLQLAEWSTVSPDARMCIVCRTHSNATNTPYFNVILSLSFLSLSYLRNYYCFRSVLLVKWGAPVLLFLKAFCCEFWCEFSFAVGVLKVVIFYFLAYLHFIQCL